MIFFIYIPTYLPTWSLVTANNFFKGDPMKVSGHCFRVEGSCLVGIELDWGSKGC